jgi:N-acetylmuramoyl-L-alanine amidase
MRIKFILLFVLICVGVIFPQRLYKITVEADGKQGTLSYIVHDGLDFVSSKELSKFLSGSNFFNPDAAKLEIKFKDYSCKFTAKSQFIILIKKNDGSQATVQLPVATILINDDVFIPLIYSCEYLNVCSGRNVSYDARGKKMSVNDNADVSKTPVAESEKENPEVKINSKYDIYAMVIEDKSNGTLIRLKTNRKLKIPHYSINNNVLYLFLSGVTVDPDISNSVQPVGLVNFVKRTSISSKNVQLEFALNEGYSTAESFLDSENNDLLISIHNKLFQSSQSVDDAKAKWIFDAIVIDAGHGGKDPGAIGVTGVKEKNINLAIALKLGNLIERYMPGIKIIYTRKTDEFIELYRRGKIANENGGKLFISIHCNSLPKKDNNQGGFEVYLLRPGRTKAAIEIAEFENSVIKYEDNPDRYQKLTDENFILVSMAHSAYMRHSEKFSDILNQDWKQNVSIPSLGIKQAGFYVLVGASMPGVLIENGFLSNRKEESFLDSNRGQAEIAQSILNAIKNYKEYYDKEISK